MERNDGGPAFPQITQNRQPDGHVYAQVPGMSLRDYMVTHLAAAWVTALSRRVGEPGYDDKACAIEANGLAILQTDAMLAARAAGGEVE